MTSDGRGGGGGSAKSDLISKGALIKHLMRGEGVKKGQKSSDVIYGRPLGYYNQIRASNLVELRLMSFCISSDFGICKFAIIDVIHLFINWALRLLSRDS